MAVIQDGIAFGYYLSKAHQCAACLVGQRLVSKMELSWVRGHSMAKPRVLLQSDVEITPQPAYTAGPV